MKCLLFVVLFSSVSFFATESRGWTPLNHMKFFGKLKGLKATKFKKLNVNYRGVHKSCHQKWKAQHKKISNIYWACVNKINTDFDKLSNRQLAKQCGNRSVQSCYNHYVKTRKKKCWDSYARSEKYWKKVNKRCEAKVAHNKACAQYARSQITLSKANMVLGCKALASHRYSDHYNWCQKNGKKAYKSHNNQRINSVKKCAGRFWMK